MWLVGVLVLVIGIVQYAHAQYYPLPVVAPQYNQNATVVPYPYQIALGLNAPASETAGTPIINQQIPAQYPYQIGYYGPNQMNLGPYYPQLGRPSWYQYGPSMGGYPGYPLMPQQGSGYLQLGAGMGYPASSGFGQSGFGQQQPPEGTISNANIKTEILDVSPEYQRQLLGWPSAETSSASRHQNQQGSLSHKPRYTVDIDTQTTNNTVIPSNLTKPIVTEKRFVTSIRRSFVYDSSKPENIKPINVHIINGQQVTTTPPPETTVNEDVQGLTTSSVKPSGRRFVDVPKSCPKGTMMAHNGECMAPFFLRNPKNSTGYVQESEETTSRTEYKR